MKYCLKCGTITSDESESYYIFKGCFCGSELVEEDDMTGEQFELLSEEEKDAYERKIFEIVKQKNQYSDRLLNMTLESPDRYHSYRFDKYEKITGKPADRKLTPEQREEQDRQFREEIERLSRETRLREYANRDREEEIKRNNIPKCPTCNSTNIEKISLSSKVVGGALFGLFSSNVRNTMHCKNCGYKW